MKTIKGVLYFAGVILLALFFYPAQSTAFNNSLDDLVIIPFAEFSLVSDTLIGLNIQNNPLSNFTLGIDTIENMILKMKETPWPIYKIKLGTDHDLEIVRALRKQSEAIFRIDANCAWDVDTTLKNAEKMKALGVEFLEQPLPREDMEGQRILFEKSPLPIIADESCQEEEDVELCRGLFHGVNIKLVKCGGFTPARRACSPCSTSSADISDVGGGPYQNSHSSGAKNWR